MSTTPAFSPGPCTTSLPRVGRRFRCTLLDLYEQCSLHITLKMPSSVMFGSRPRILWMRAYSSRVTPCSAAIYGVTRISVLAVAIYQPTCEGRSCTAPPQKQFPLPYRSSCGLCGADERFDHGMEYNQAVGGAERRFDGAFGMGHESGDIAPAVADASDIVNGAVGIAGVVVGTIGRRIVENNLMIFFEICERGFVAIVVAVGMRDRNLEDLTFLRSIGEWRARLLDADVDVAADEAQAAVPHHGAGKEARFTQNLEAVADAQDHAAAFREFFDGFHHRRKTRDGASAQVIAVGESAGQDNGIAICQILRLVPDEFDGLFQDVADSVKRVVVTIGPGENDDSKFHVAPAPCGIAGTSILAHAHEFRRDRIKQEENNAETQRARRNRKVEEKPASEDGRYRDLPGESGFF